jgi:hypothetical protein
VRQEDTSGIRFPAFDLHLAPVVQGAAKFLEIIIRQFVLSLKSNNSGAFHFWGKIRDILIGNEKRANSYWLNCCIWPAKNFETDQSVSG